MRKIIVSDLVKEYGASDNKVMANDRLSFKNKKVWLCYHGLNGKKYLIKHTS